jgi:hypothetical protein
MDEEKYDKLLNAAIVLLIVSATVLGVSVYKIYFKENKPAIAAKPKTIKVNNTRDSLQKVYTNTIVNLDSSISATPKTDTVLQAKYAEMDTLKSEIAALLQGQGENDLSTAKLKIEELQIKVALLQNKYTNVEAENKRLQLLISQLMAANKNSKGKELSPAAYIEKAKATLQQEKASVITTNAATELRLYTVAENNNKEIETSSADLAQKIVGTFNFKNNSKSNGELMVVVLQPDGKPLKNSVWETGAFETKEGKKIYSKKLFVDAQQEEKKVNISLSPDSFMKGNYTMQVWQNGNMIAKTSKILGQ